MKESTEDLIQSYFPEKSPGTRKAYAADLDTFSSYLGTKTAKEALELLFSLPQNRANLVVLHYKAEIDNSGMKASSINRKLSALRSVVREANRMDKIPWTLEVANEKIETEATDISLAKTDIQKLIQAARFQKNPVKSARDVAIIRLMFDLALKRGCLVRLQMDDIDFENRSLKVKPDHCSEIRSKFIPAVTEKALRSWIACRGDEPGMVFLNVDRAGKGKGISSTSIYRIVQNLGKKLGMKVTPDDIRKAAIAEAVVNAGHLGFSDHEILAFTDHKQVSSLKHFKKKQSRSQMMISSLISRN